MKKKSLLISGLIVLGAAVGVTSYAVSSGAPGISLFADGDDEEVTPVVPTVFSPARGSYHLPSENVNSAYLEFTGTVVPDFSEDKVISLWLDKSSSTAVSYSKVKEWSTTDEAAISLEGNRLNINFGLEEPLAVGTYYIDVPEGVVLVDGVPNAAYDHTDASKQWTFEVKDPVPVSKTNPANGEVIGSSVNLQTLVLTYEKLGDGGVSNIIRTAENNIIIKKDGEVLYTIPSTDTKAIQLDPNWVDNVNIKLPEPLTEAGVYTVEVPAGMFIVKGLSAAIEWSFTIQAEVTAEISMADGLTYPFAAFANFVMTYPEGTTIEVNPGKTAVLENFKLGQTVKISDYEAVVDKNVVTLKAKDMSKMPVANNKNTNYMKIDVPAGLFTITSNGSSYENPAKVYEKFLSTAYADSDFQFIPAIGSDVTVDQLKEITFLIPEGSVYCGGKLATTTVLTVVPNNSGNTNYKYEYKFKSISEDGRQVVAVLNESETGLANNLAYFQKGEAYIKVAANFIQVEGTTNKNGAVAVKAYNVTDGITTAPIYESSPNDGAAESSISSFSLKFPCNVVVNNENAEITLSMDGKLVKTVKAGETTTAAAKADGAGANTVAYSNIFKDEDGNNFTTPGVYTFNVPADAYKQVGQDYLSTAYEATVYIVRNVDFEIYPKPATFSGTAKELIVTPGTEFTELTSFTLTYAENTTVELTEDWKSALYNAAIGKVGASALLKDPIVSVPTNQSGYAMNRVEVDGNKVTIYLNMPYNIATPANYGLGIKIPKGVFIVNVPNEDGTVTKCANDQILEYYQGVPMAAGRLGVVSLGANGAAEAQYINAENNFIMSSELNELVYTAYETLYPAKTTPKAELRDEDGNLIATYSGAAVDADKLPGMSAASIAFTPDAEYAEAIAGIKTSTVKFVVLEHTLQGGSATSATTMVFNTSDFTYELNVLETTMTPSVETGGSVAELSNIEFSFSDVLAIAVNEEVVPVVTYVDTYTEGAMSGEKYNRSIAEDGYKVELQASGIPEEEAIAEGDDDFGTKGNVARLVITPALTKEDTYTIHIPAGALLLNGVVKSAAIDMTVKVEAPKDVEFEDYIVKQTPAGDEITIGDTFYKMGMGNIVVTAKDGAVLNKDCKEKAQLQCLIPSLGMEEPMVVGTASVEDINDMGEMENPNPFAEGDEEGDAEGETKAGTNYILTFQLEDENMQQLLIQPGIWMVNIPVGMFTVNGANVKEGTLQYNLAAVSKDYTWTINPENGTEFEDAISGDIVLTIEGAEEVSYDNAPATLIGPDGNKVIGFGSSPALGTNTLTWKITSTPNYTYEEGEYTLTIKKESIGADVDMEMGLPGNFPTEDIVVKYIVKKAPQTAVEFDEYITKVTPADEEEITLADTFYQMGMGNIIIGVKDGAVLNTECKEKAELMCVIPSQGINEPMTVGTADVESVINMGGGGDNPEPMAEGAVSNYIVQFDLVDEAMETLLTQPGMWIVTFPEGMFTVNGANVTEGSLQYNLVGSTKEYTWTITPANGTDFEGSISGEIVLTVEGADYVTYDTAPASLTNDKGERVTAFNSTPAAKDNTITWSFYENSPYLFVDGEYTLTIRKNTIGADMDAERTGEGNFPTEDITVTYLVHNGTGVALIGVDAADSYDVYTMDGKVVLLNAGNDAMLNLAPGMYIINGKKAFVRK